MFWTLHGLITSISRICPCRHHQRFIKTVISCQRPSLMYLNNIFFYEAYLTINYGWTNTKYINLKYSFIHSPSCITGSPALFFRSASNFTHDLSQCRRHTLTLESSIYRSLFKLHFYGLLLPVEWRPQTRKF